MHLRHYLSSVRFAFCLHLSPLSLVNDTSSCHSYCASTQIYLDAWPSSTLLLTSKLQHSMTAFIKGTSFNKVVDGVVGVCVSARPPAHLLSTTGAFWQAQQATGWRQVLLAVWFHIRVGMVTYWSRNPKVKQAGLVADLNAVVLAAAVILLITSRNTFMHAEKSTLSKGWENLLQDNLTAACTTLKHVAYAGDARQGIAIGCQSQPGCFRSKCFKRAQIDVRNKTHLVPVLRIMETCNAFSMVLDNLEYHRTQPCRVVSETTAQVIDRLEIYMEDHAVMSASLLRVYSSKRTFVDAENKTVNCTTYPSFSKTLGQQPPEFKSTFEQSVCTPGSPAGFSSDMSILRWLDSDNNKGVYFGLSECDNAEVRACVIRTLRSAENSNLMATINTDVRIVRGHGNGSFCPEDHNMSVIFGTKSPYRCTDGVETGSIDALSHQVTAVRGYGQELFVFYRCLSFDELFGVYVGIVGLFLAVCLATVVVFCSKVISPMYQAGGHTWFARRQASYSCKHRAFDVADIILRCLWSFGLGAAVSSAVVLVLKNVEDKTFKDGAWCVDKDWS